MIQQMTQRPRCNPPQWEWIPVELKESSHSLCNWVFGRYELSGGKWTKPPVMLFQQSGKGGFYCIDASVQENRRSYEVVKEIWDTIGEESVAEGQIDFVGYYLSRHPYWPEKSAIIGIDIDHCIRWDIDDLFNARPIFDKWAQRVIDRLPDTYIEFSPSREGIHIFVKGVIPQSVKYSPAGIEIYDSGRYFTVTGDVFNAVPIAECTTEITAIVNDLLKLREKEKPAVIISVVPSHSISSVSIEERLRIAFAASNGSKIKSLFDGDMSAFVDGSDDGVDHSMADMALLRGLCFYSEGSADLLYQMFFRSKLYREKKEKYLRATIEKVLQTETKFWQPAQSLSLNGSNGHQPQIVVSSPDRFSVSDLKEKAIQYRHRVDLWGLESVWNNLNKIYRPRSGLLTVWTGEPGSGKSTFILAYIYNFCIKNRLKAALCSFELNPPERIVLELAQIHTQLNPFQSQAYVSSISDTDLAKAIDEFAPYFSVLHPDWSARNVEGIVSLIRDEAVLYLDPFTELQPPDRLLGKYTDFASVQLSLLRDFTERNQRITHLVCHPTKQFNRSEGLRLWNINGSGDFERKCDFGIVLNREGNTTIAHIQKVRDRLTGIEDSKAAFALDTEAYYFRETTVPMRLKSTEDKKEMPF